MNKSHSLDENFDVAIAGGGLAGCLAAHYLSHLNPEKKIILLEKEPTLGGRLVTGASAHDAFGYGLSGITPRLYEFWNQALKKDPEGPDLPSLTSTRIQELGVLTGSKIARIQVTDAFTPTGAKIVGGTAAATEWKNLSDILEQSDNTQKPSTLGDLWKQSRKSGAASVLETFAGIAGLTNVWDTAPNSIKQRIDAVSSAMYVGGWHKAIDHLLEPLVERGTLKISCNSRIINCTAGEDQKWAISTAQGFICASSLIVAQSPWVASQWLEKHSFPPALAAIASKTKPVSVAVLSCRLEGASLASLPQLLCIPSEDVTAIFCDGEIVFQAVIDYEVSLVAPDVVKSIKRLKRALNKFLSAFADLKAEREHVALVPIAWAQPTSLSEQKYLQKIQRSIQTPHLAFCGDAYGTSLDGDANLIESVQTAIEAIAK